MKVHVAVTAADVKAEAARRILARYPLWKQINIIREGDVALAEMSAFIDRIRVQSDALEALVPIPVTFREDKHWL